jgi:hypothetical protein
MVATTAFVLICANAIVSLVRSLLKPHLQLLVAVADSKQGAQEQSNSQFVKEISAARAALKILAPSR